jgi:enamine deaminase RidA (YjgF/YER057c/UK114 family)
VVGTTVAIGDVAAQAEQVMDNLRTALRAAGADLQEPLSRDRLGGDQDVFDVAEVR